MKKLKYILFAFLLLLTLTSCNDLLVVNSTDFVESGNNKLSSPNDSLYSIFGILSEFQKLGDSYIILGDLRADLMDVTENSDQDLRDINSLNISKSNSYLNAAKYYSVINNCNFVIAHMDTLVDKKALIPDYAAAISIRGWCYYQLAINYEYVRYTDKPILDVNDLLNNENFPKKNRNEIFNLIISQLKSIENVPLPAYNLTSGPVTVPVKYMIPTPTSTIADLYLWNGEYENAAIYYRKMMDMDYGYLSTNNTGILYNQYLPAYSNSWISNFNKSGFNDTITIGSTNGFGYEVNKVILYNSKSGNQSGLDKLVKSSYKVRPTSLSIDNWIAQSLFTTNFDLQLLGDRRGYSSSWEESSVSGAIVPRILKSVGAKRVILSRGAYYHLRYAEAINRLGKPSIALAEINYGLNNTILNDTGKVRAREKVTPGKTYMVFNNIIYNNCSGLRAHVGLNPILIPKTVKTLADSILFVEDAIVAEAALETAFEGVRWTDLVRIALRRSSIDITPKFQLTDSWAASKLTSDEQQKLIDDNYLGNAVSKKFELRTKSRYLFLPTANAADIKTKLNSGQTYWFLPFPE